jgi:hypothetical protein
MLRYARYAPATFFALLAAGFVALWVRSYDFMDAASGPIGKWYVFPSTIRGTTMIEFANSATFVQVEKKWRFSSTPLNSMGPIEDHSKHTTFGFGIRPRSRSICLYFPLWVLVAASLGLAALFAIKRTWRYSLRTILVATTLLAGLLGLAVYAV